MVAAGRDAQDPAHHPNRPDTAMGIDEAVCHRLAAPTMNAAFSGCRARSARAAIRASGGRSPRLRKARHPAVQNRLLHPELLKDDKRAIFAAAAAAHAQRAADFLHGLQPLIEENSHERGAA